MLENFISVFEQVLILFALMAFGYIFNKTKKLTKEACAYISDIVVTFVAPCVIIKSFIRSYEPEMLKMLFVALGLSGLLHIMMAVVSRLVLKDSDEKKRRVKNFASIFSNAGFIGLPLQQQILGGDGVFYGAAYIVMFNIIVWSYGVADMSGDRSAVTFKKLMVSPGIIGVVIGVICFVFSYKPPVVIYTVIDYVAAINVPLPMFVIGYYLADVDLLNAFRDKSLYLCMTLRLLVYPILAIVMLKLLNIDSTLAMSLVIAVSAPVGAMTSMFSEKFGADTELSVKLVSISTLISVITMPIMVAIAGVI